MCSAAIAASRASACHVSFTVCVSVMVLSAHDARPHRISNCASITESHTVRFQHDWRVNLARQTLANVAAYPAVIAASDIAQKSCKPTEERILLVREPNTNFRVPDL